MSDASVDSKVDRLARSYLLTRALYWAMLETAAAHYARVVEGPDVADLVGAIQTAATKDPDPDSVERDAQILEALQTVGDLDDVISPLQLLALKQSGIARLVSTYRLEEQAVTEAALKTYADEQGDDEDPPANFTAWQRARDEDPDGDDDEDPDDQEGDENEDPVEDSYSDQGEPDPDADED